MSPSRRHAFLLPLLAVATCALSARADWPAWRGDAGHTGVCTAKLPDKLLPQWTRKLPPQIPAWKDETSMQFDRSYEPIAAGGLLIVASTVNDSVAAYDLSTGAEKWRFFTEGPVRFAPAAWKDRVFVGSDDGYLYCLNLADGKLLWKFCATPKDRRVLGNERIISAWPIRGGPAVADNTVYFAAGVWPFMGTFVYALDAGSGKLVWFNDESSFTFRLLPHPGAYGFSGLSPQGYIAVVGDRLVIPGSRSNPGLFDRKTGRFLGFPDGAGVHAAGRGQFAFVGGSLIDPSLGEAVYLENAPRGGPIVLDEKLWYVADGVIDLSAVKLEETRDRPKWFKGRPATGGEEDDPPLPTAALVGSAVKKPWLRTTGGAPWLLAGNRLVTAGKTGLQILDVSDPANPKPVTQITIDGAISSVIASDDKLIVATLTGTITCFGPNQVDPKTYGAPVSAFVSGAAEEILRAAGRPEGYAIVVGLKDGAIVENLAQQPNLKVLAIDPDPAKVAAVRKRLNDQAGLYGAPAAVICADPTALPIGPYIASLVCSEDPAIAKGPAFAAAIFNMLRPYGGVAVLPITDADFAAARLPGAELKKSADLTLLSRPGALPGSADFVGQNGDPGATRCSKDKLVMAPLGILWWGNAMSNALILPRHGEGPVEQVVAGRLFIEGPDSITGCDVYTGRVLWTRQFPGLGKYYDNTRHQLGAHALGANFFAVADAVYVANNETCEVLDTATGKTLSQFKLPGNSQWLFMLVYEDLLIAGRDPVVIAAKDKPRYSKPAISKGLVVMDRKTGKILWQRDARESFRHYGIAAGANKIFAADGATILALDARTGKPVWESAKCGHKLLSYSEEHDIVLADGALRGKDGSVVWDTLQRAPSYLPTTGPGTDADAAEEVRPAGLIWWGKWGPMIVGNQIITQGTRSIDLFTGKQKTIAGDDGAERGWGFRRAHGCGPMAANVNLMTFRSGCSGFFDLKNDGGTGNLGGFRTGCTSNLIAANGVMNAPDYTRTCTCGYSNRSSLAMIHLPDAEYWTFGTHPKPGRIGYNFGAPGDRMDDDGTLWQESPSQTDLDNPIEPLVPTVPADAERFYIHSSRLADGQGHKWVCASGLKGIKSAKIPLAHLDPAKDLTVRLYFAEPDNAAPGHRIFTVTLDGAEVIKDLDIARESGLRKGMMKELKNIRAKGKALELNFTPTQGQPLICGVELLQAP